LVVIVNAQSPVDKIGLLHKISSLRHRQGAGQGLYRACTDVGKKTASLQEAVFCTSHPVDMQRLVHSRACIRRAFCRQAGTTGVQQPVLRSQAAPACRRHDEAAFLAGVRIFAFCQTCKQSIIYGTSFSANGCRPIFFGRPDLDSVCSRDLRGSFFCQTAWCLLRQDLCPGQEQGAHRFSQDACFIYLIKRDVYKLIVVVNAAVYCG
jgi:hypothetical protein